MSGEVQPPTTLARMASVLCASPIVGVSLAVFGLFRVFEAAPPGSAPDPAIMKQYLTGPLYIAAVGMVLALVGFPTALWCLFARRQRAWCCWPIGSLVESHSNASYGWITCRPRGCLFSI